MAPVICSVSVQHVRFDLVANGRLYLGAAVHGSGGILCEKEARRALVRLSKKVERGERIRIYTNVGAADSEFFDATDVRALSAFVPGVEA